MVVCLGFDIGEKRCSPTIHAVCGPGSSVGLVTDYGLDGAGIESRRDFPPVQTGPGAHPASCKMGTGSFPGIKYGRGMLLTTHPLLVLRAWKSRAIPLPTTGPVTGKLYLSMLYEIIWILRTRKPWCSSMNYLAQNVSESFFAWRLLLLSKNNHVSSLLCWRKYM